MAKTGPTVRKLVTLPEGMASRAEAFRNRHGFMHESDALAALIADGLKMNDTSDDLFASCEAVTANGQDIRRLINMVTDRHPLVRDTRIDGREIIVSLVPDAEFRHEWFRFSRAERTWTRGHIHAPTPRGAGG